MITQHPNYPSYFVCGAGSSMLIHRFIPENNELVLLPEKCSSFHFIMALDCVADKVAIGDIIDSLQMFRLKPVGDNVHFPENFKIDRIGKSMDAKSINVVRFVN